MLTLESFSFIPDEVFVSVNLCLDKSTTINCHPCSHPVLACQELSGGDNLHYLIVSSKLPFETDQQTIIPNHIGVQTRTWENRKLVLIHTGRQSRARI